MRSSLTAERGSAYTLLHPEYSVVVPKPRPSQGAARLRRRRPRPAAGDVVNTWIDLKRKDGTIDELFGHWILGRDATPHAPPLVDSRRRAGLGEVGVLPLTPVLLPQVQLLP